MSLKRLRSLMALTLIFALFSILSVSNAFANTPHKGPIVGGAISGDGRVFVTMSDHPDHTLVFWDASTGKGLRRVKTGQLGHQSAIALSPDGKLTATGTRTYGGDTYELAIFDTDKGQILHKMRIHKPKMENINLSVLDLQFSPDGTKLLVTTKESLGFIYDPLTGKQLSHFQARFGGVTGISAAWLPDGKRVLLGSDGEAGLVDTVNNKILKTYTGIYKTYDVDVSSDGKLAALTGRSEVYIVEIETGKTITTFKNSNIVTDVVFIPNSSLVACTDAGNRVVTLFDAKTGKELTRVEIPAAFLNFPNYSNSKVSGLSTDNKGKILIINSPAMPYMIPLE